MNIIAVVVTYNRMELLKRNIRCLQQNKPISSIVIVNNGSTDGTTEWLAAQEGLTVINQTNVGGAGGFYTGIQYAYQAGADWIWCMDDDVFPRADCLEQLLPYTGKKDIGILAPRRLLEGEIFTHDFQAYNLSNPFVSMYSKKLAGRHITSPTEITGTAFEGPFIRREVVEKIGLPNKDLFIINNRHEVLGADLFQQSFHIHIHMNRLIVPGTVHLHDRNLFHLIQAGKIQFF